MRMRVLIATALIVLMSFAGLLIAQVPPSNLRASSGDKLVDLLWEPPDWGFWLHWDNGDGYTGIGTNTEIVFKSAIRFPPDSLQAFNVGSRRLTEVMFIPRHAGCEYSINVWVGGTPTNPDELVVDQLVENPIVNSWNNVVLNRPVRIDPTQELWIGVNYDTDGGHPAGCDNGPEIDGFGNMIWINGGWQTLIQANHELTYNWSIRGFVGPIEERGEYQVLTNKGVFSPEELDDDVTNNLLIYDEDSSPENRETKRRNYGKLTIDPNWETQRTSGIEELYRHDVLGYNVYRDGDIINDELLDGLRYRDRDVENYQNYTYQVTALYRGGESRMSNEAEATPKLPRPFDLTALGGESVVKLKWDSYDHPELLGFNVYRNNNLINEEPLIVTRFNDYEVENGTLYSYFIKSVYMNDIITEPSNTVQVRPEVLETPHNLRAVTGDGLVLLRWDAPDNDDYISFKLYRDNQLLSQQEDLTFFDEDVVNGTEYTYHVSSLYPQGESSPSEPIIVVPKIFEITPPPRHLTAAGSGVADIKLNWEEPINGHKIQWDSGQNANSFGTGSALQFKAAIRFTPYELVANGAGNKKLIEVMFYPTYFNGIYTVNVWTGGSLTGPEQLMAEQRVEQFEVDSWNTVVLNSPVFIDVTKELWIGLSIVTPAGRPIGGDNGPAEIGYGNLIYYNNSWSPLTNLNPAYNYNWNIQGFVSFDDDSSQRLTKKENEHTERGSFVVAEDKERLDILGYNLYRDDNKLNTEPIKGTSYLDEGLVFGSLYEYYVTSVYQDKESEPSNRVVIELSKAAPEYPSLTQLFDNYPNPFNPQTCISFILSKSSNVEITIYNITGQRITTVYDDYCEAGRHSVVWDGKDENGKLVGSGIYFYRMNTNYYTATKKMVMIK